jgi:DNA-binding LytR/AlgR family response regulator
MPDTPMNVLIVDDEPPARELLRAYASQRPDLRLVGEAEDGESALEMIDRLAPDVVLLDIHMPGLDGLELASRLRGAERAPHIVFVTAYDEHAVGAFDVEATDYLLKPVTAERFNRALDRCMNAAAESSPVPALADRPRSTPPRLVIRDRGRITLLRVTDVDWLQSEGDYVRVHLAGKSHLVEKTVADMEVLLAPHGFARVHRGAIVNLDRIQQLHVEGSGRYLLVLAGGAELVVSRSYSHLFRQEML